MEGGNRPSGSLALGAKRVIMTSFLLALKWTSPALAMNDGSIVERELNLDDYKVDVVLLYCPEKTWDDTSVAAFTRAVANTANFFCQRNLGICRLRTWNRSEKFSPLHVQYANIETRKDLNVVRLSVLILYNLRMNIVSDPERTVQKALVPKEAVAAMFKNHDEKIRQESGWRIVDAELDPKYGPVTTWMNNALLPLGLLIACFVVLVARWSVSITASSEMDLVMRIQKKRMKKEDTSLHHLRARRGSTLRGTDDIESAYFVADDSLSMHTVSAAEDESSRSRPPSPPSTRPKSSHESPTVPRIHVDVPLSTDVYRSPRLHRKGHEHSADAVFMTGASQYIEGAGSGPRPGSREHRKRLMSEQQEQQQDQQHLQTPDAKNKKRKPSSKPSAASLTSIGTGAGASPELGPKMSSASLGRHASTASGMPGSQSQLVNGSRSSRMSISGAANQKPTILGRIVRSIVGPRGAHSGGDPYAAIARLSSSSSTRTRQAAPRRAQVKTKMMMPMKVKRQATMKRVAGGGGGGRGGGGLL